MTPSDASRWSDLDRPPLNEAALRRALVRPGGLWTELEVVPGTGSTNTDLLQRVKAGAQRVPPKGPDAGAAAEGAVLVAEEQTAGRGRLDRHWCAPPRSGLFFSVLLRPGAAGVPQRRWSWLPLLAGVATASALARVAGVDTALKWPNDLLADIGGEELKIGGLLCEQAGQDAVVVGIGLNVSLTRDELPVPAAGSLLLAGAPHTDRDPLLRAVLRSLEEWYVRWRDAGGDPDAGQLHATYAAGCTTLGRQVRAVLPGGGERTGEAVAIDGDGRLVLASADGLQQPVSAADIVHLRSSRGE